MSKRSLLLMAAGSLLTLGAGAALQVLTRPAQAQSGRSPASAPTMVVAVGEGQFVVVEADGRWTHYVRNANGSVAVCAVGARYAQVYSCR